MSNKVTGTVKWFSNRKGFGFIAPTSDNTPTQEEIFVHQTSIQSDGAYRTLTNGSDVAFEVVKEEDTDKYKAVNVTLPDGSFIKPPPRERRRNRNRGGDSDADSNEEGDAGGDKPRRRRNKNGEKKPQAPPFHDALDDAVKDTMKERGFELGKKTTIDIAIADARIKLGQGGYAAVALANGTVGEGTYACEPDGKVKFEWKHAIEFKDEWKPTEPSKLMDTIVLAGDGVGPVDAEDTVEKLWGEGKTDPSPALEANGFQMRRVVITRPTGGGRGGRGRRQRGGGGGDGEAAVKTEE